MTDHHQPVKLVRITHEQPPGEPPMGITHEQVSTETPVGITHEQLTPDLQSRIADQLCDPLSDSPQARIEVWPVERAAAAAYIRHLLDVPEDNPEGWRLTRAVEWDGVDPLDGAPAWVFFYCFEDAQAFDTEVVVYLKNFSHTDH